MMAFSHVISLCPPPPPPNSTLFQFFLLFFYFFFLSLFPSLSHLTKKSITDNLTLPYPFPLSSHVHNPRRVSAQRHRQHLHCSRLPSGPDRNQHTTSRFMYQPALLHQLSSQVGRAMPGQPKAQRVCPFWPSVHGSNCPSRTYPTGWFGWRLWRDHR